MAKMGKERDKDMRGLLQVKYCRVRYRNLAPRQLRKRQDRSKEREKKRQREIIVTRPSGIPLRPPMEESKPRDNTKWYEVCKYPNCIDDNGVCGFYGICPLTSGNESSDYSIIRNAPLHTLTDQAFHTIARTILNAKPVKPKRR